ncbi:MAG TPA: hypothetical protein VH476_11370 [Solirubrobacterales bacterium]|jgi:hypothetical protein
MKTIKFLIGVAALLVGLSAMSANAGAYVGVNYFTMVPSGTQAGGHPDVTLEMEWDNSQIHEGEFTVPDKECQCDDARIVAQHFPTGFIGNPHATPRCEIAEFAQGRCPASTQIGVAEPFGPGEFYVPMYNMTPHPDEASLTAFWVPLVAAPVFVTLASRTESDYGLDAESSPIFHPLAINALGIKLWGVPADPVHDIERFIPPLKGFAACGGFFGCPEVTGAKANIPPVPYLQAPTECNVPLVGSLDLSYYTGEVIHADDPWPSTTGCEQLTFNPSLTAQPTSQQADSPSGVDIDLKVPQELSPTTPSPSEIRSTTVTLPDGFSINSSAADGKVSCSDADSAIGTRHAATCPDFSKIGTLSLDSSALPVPIPGAIYLGDPKPGDRYRILLTANGFGTHVKLFGSIFPNTQTGQLVVKFIDLPQSPLTEFNMHFFGSERGLLATPTQCGEYPVESEFVPWDGSLPDQTSLSHFTIDSGPNGAPCPSKPRSFSPQLQSGTADTTAGAYSPFSFELTRAPGDQNLSTVQLQGPPGFLASLRGVPYCPDSAIAASADPSYTAGQELANPKCPASTKIGVSTTGAGAGSHQVYLPGTVYMAGPYKGAPFSIVIVTPVVSGPYDLGNVVVRSAVSVDPLSAKVIVHSDPLPQIIEGIPLRLRDVQVDLNRPGFTLNPTNCDPFAVETTIGGDEGGVATPKASFQVANCSNLAYGPKLQLKLSGGLKRRGHPAIKAVLDTGLNEANTRKVSVTLPKSGLLDNAHINTICTKAQFNTSSCPDGSRIGEATANTPLLDQPLSGPIYLRSSNVKLPDMVVDLRGQIGLQLVGKVDSVNGRLRTRFTTLPDAPVTKFTLNLVGGKKGLLINSTNLCKTPQKAQVEMAGQNGVHLDRKTKLQLSCGSKASRHKRHSSSRAVR